MRARRGTVVGWATVVAYAALCLAAAIPELDDEPPARGEEAAVSFLRAWERYRTATFVVVSTFERRSGTGATLRSRVVLAQRPPDQVVKQFGGVQGRIGSRPLLCGAVPTGEPRCIEGPPGRSYDEVVAAELELLRSYVSGPRLYYSLIADGGCFTLRRLRPHPLSPYGREARICFDDETGAVSSLRVDHGGVIDTTKAVEVRLTVTDEDLRPD